MRRVFTTVLFLLLSFTSDIIAFGNSEQVFNPTEYSSKAEIRGIFIATVNNIDIGIQRGVTENDINNFKQQFLTILDTVDKYNLNAIFFQVRPQSDAFYNSNLNPWSRYITGEEGQYPGWDVLSWMIEETHKRNIEFHAWLNPYRVVNYTSLTKTTYLESLSTENFAYKNGDLVLDVPKDSGRQLILNPGEPLVQQFIIDTVKEIIENYEVDGIHFDDYFYPYQDIKMIDYETYQKYGTNNISIEDWRRDNINKVIKGVNDTIDNSKRFIQFGISPFGIWANKSSNPLGSSTFGLESYTSIYADSYKWVKEEWVDYIAPQVYWDFQNRAAPYAEVISWWVNVVAKTNVKLYIGQALYRYGEVGGWQNYMEVPNQLLFNQNFNEIEGSIFFSYSQLVRMDNPTLTLGREKLKELYEKETLLPAYGSGDKHGINESLSLSLSIDGISLYWETDDKIKYYQVIREKVLSKILFNNSTYIEIADKNIDLTKTSSYVIVGYDFSNNQVEESQVIYDPLNYLPIFTNLNEITLKVHNKLLLPEDVRAYDFFGNDITTEIKLVEGNLDTTKTGDYLVNVSVSDSYNRVKTQAINVKVIDDTVPEISVLPISIPVSMTNFNYRKYITVKDNYDAKDSLYLFIDDSLVDYYTLGTYDLKISVKDSNNNYEDIVTRVKVIDNEPPKITVAEIQTYEVNSIPAYMDTLFLTDNYDKELYAQVDSTLVDMTKVGSYIVRYYASDLSNNQVVTEALIYVVDTAKPEISGIDTFSAKRNQPVDYLNFITAYDNYDGDLTSKIEIDDSNVDISRVGVYKVYIKVSDSSGNVNYIEANILVNLNDKDFFVLISLTIIVVGLYLYKKA